MVVLYFSHLTPRKLEIMSFRNKSPTCPVWHRGKAVGFPAGCTCAIFPVLLPLLEHGSHMWRKSRGVEQIGEVTQRTIAGTSGKLAPPVLCDSIIPVEIHPTVTNPWFHYCCAAGSADKKQWMRFKVFDLMCFAMLREGAVWMCAFTFKMKMALHPSSPVSSKALVKCPQSHSFGCDSQHPHFFIVPLFTFWKPAPIVFNKRGPKPFCYYLWKW